MPTENETLRELLNEGNNVILAFASNAGATDAAVQAAFDLAEAAKRFSPTTWRTIWIKDPSALEADLSQAVWGTGAPVPALLLALGTGLSRDRKAFDLSDLSSRTAVLGAFAHRFGQGGAA